jgi:hypothetical protein
MVGIYWEVRKTGNQHLAEAWRGHVDGGGVLIVQPLHEVVAGDLYDIRRDLLAKGFMPCCPEAARPDVLEIWCHAPEIVAPQSPTRRQG